MFWLSVRSATIRRGGRPPRSDRHRRDASVDPTDDTPGADDMTSPDQTTTMQRAEDVVPHLLAAMVRVLSGRPSKAEPGDLTITAVAVESGLKRHYLTHKHPELKDLFYQLRDHHQNPVQHAAAQLKSEIDDLKRRLGDANDQRRKWKTTAETYARAIEVLTLEKGQLQQSLHARHPRHDLRTTEPTS